MKNLFSLLVLGMLCCLRAQAQESTSGVPPERYFDPTRDPVAVRIDSVLHFVVSEYVLASAASAARALLGQDYHVTQVSKARLANGNDYLVIEGTVTGSQPSTLSYRVRLIPDALHHFYYPSAMAEITCESNGCGNCFLGGSSSCASCCTALPSTPGSSLQKVPNN